VFGDDSDGLLLFYALVTGKEWPDFIVDVIRKLSPPICTDDTDRNAKPTTEARRHGENQKRTSPLIHADDTDRKITADYADNRGSKTKLNHG